MPAAEAVPAAAAEAAEAAEAVAAGDSSAAVGGESFEVGAVSATPRASAAVGAPPSRSAAAPRRLVSSRADGGSILHGGSVVRGGVQGGVHEGLAVAPPPVLGLSPLELLKGMNRQQLAAVLNDEGGHVRLAAGPGGVSTHHFLFYFFFCFSTWCHTSHTLRWAPIHESGCFVLLDRMFCSECFYSPPHFFLFTFLFFHLVSHFPYS